MKITNSRWNAKLQLYICFPFSSIQLMTSWWMQMSTNQDQHSRNSLIVYTVKQYTWSLAWWLQRNQWTHQFPLEGGPARGRGSNPNSQTPRVARLCFWILDWCDSWSSRSPVINTFFTPGYIAHTYSSVGQKSFRSNTMRRDLAGKLPHVSFVTGRHLQGIPVAVVWRDMVVT